MENFTEDLRYDYPALNADSVVIDLGCYEGTFAAKIHEKYGCRVFSFEPIPSFFDRCRDRFNGHVPKVVVLNLAVGGASEELEFKIKGDMSGMFADQGETCKVRMVTMAEVLKMLGIEKVDLLKINIEGGEFELLETMFDAGLMNKFANIQVQWHDVVTLSKTRFHNLQLRLGITHHLTFDHGWVWQNWRLNGL